MKDLGRSVVKVAEQGKQDLIEDCQSLLLLVHSHIPANAQHAEIAISTICSKRCSINLVSYGIIGILAYIEYPQNKRNDARHN